MLTITHELSEALAEFRDATGTSPASFVTGLLLEALPMIRNVTRAAQLAKQQHKAEAFDVLSSTLADALHDGAGIQREILAEGHKIRRASGTPKRTPAEEAQDAAEDAEFSAAYASMLEAAEDEKKSREELRQELIKLREKSRK